MHFLEGKLRKFFFEADTNSCPLIIHHGLITNGPIDLLQRNQFSLKGPCLIDASMSITEKEWSSTLFGMIMALATCLINGMMIRWNHFIEWNELKTWLLLCIQQLEHLKIEIRHNQEVAEIF